MLTHFPAPASLLTYSFQASSIQFAMTSSCCSRGFTSLFRPLTASSASWVRPVASSLFVAELPYCRNSSTISTWPFAMAWKRVVCLLFWRISVSLPILRRNAAFLSVYANIALSYKMKIFVVIWRARWDKYCEARKYPTDILIAICL